MQIPLQPSSHAAGPVETEGHGGAFQGLAQHFHEFLNFMAGNRKRTGPLLMNINQQKKEARK